MRAVCQKWQCKLRRSAASGFFHEARERQKRASLVETGRHAGRSRVNFGGFRGVTLNYHAWKRGACALSILSHALWVKGALSCGVALVFCFKNERAFALVAAC